MEFKGLWNRGNFRQGGTHLQGKVDASQQEARQIGTLKREESLAAQTAHYQDLLTTLGQQEEFLQNDKPLTVKRSGFSHAALYLARRAASVPLVAKQQQQQLLEAPNCIGSSNMPVVIIERFASFAGCHTPNCSSTTTTLLIHHLASCHAPDMIRTDFLPLPLPLRARTSRRCLVNCDETFRFSRETKIESTGGWSLKSRKRPMVGKGWGHSRHSQIDNFKTISTPSQPLIQMANPNMCTVSATCCCCFPKEVYREEYGNDNQSSIRLWSIPSRRITKMSFWIGMLLATWQHRTLWNWNRYKTRFLKWDESRSYPMQSQRGMDRRY